ncbi:hypothetical protein LTR86_004163 [Recurvomyces mirabilis]|nr:hypothetical protein LTR86_004163 [Recurvomyces mirabilis]
MQNQEPTELPPTPTSRPVLHRNKTTSAIVNSLTTFKSPRSGVKDPPTPPTPRLDSVVATRDWERVLEQAQSRLDEGKREICRGLCWEIVIEDGVRPETKVYAYNILSMLASSGNAYIHLDKSTKLVKSSITDEQKQAKLLKAIGELRASFK